MTKILYVITKSNWGGAQRYVFDLATSLPKGEFEVTVALGGTGDKSASAGLLEKKLGEKGIRTIFVRSFMRDISIFREFAALFELIGIFKKERPNVVHLNSSKAGGTGALAARIARVPKIVFTSHGWAFNESRNPLALAVIKVLQWLTVVLSHKTICVSHFDANRIKHWPLVKSKVTVIHNGIAPMEFGSAKAIRDEFREGVHITGTIGELNKNKNQIALIEQVKNDPNLHLIIVGDGENRGFLIKKIEEYSLQDRVRLIGFRPASEVLRGFDTFALPSIKEGLPYVLIEARQAGLPIIANRIGGIGEILDCSDMNEFSLDQMLKKTIEIYRSR